MGIARQTSRLGEDGHSALLAVLLAVTQALVEGARWQLVPAYALTGLFSLVWLLRHDPSADQPAGRHWIDRLAVGLAGLGLAASVLLPTVLPVFHLQRPGGPYESGTLTYSWVDAGRREVFSDDPNAHRELVAQVWYPAKGDSSSPRAPHIATADAVALLETHQP